MADWTKSNWFRHRIGSIGGDPKLGKLVRKYGAEGYAVYFMSLEYIYEGFLGDMEIEAIASTLRIDEARVIDILEYAENSCKGLLVKCGEDEWQSQKAELLQKEDEEKRVSERTRIKKYRDKKKEEYETRTNKYEQVRTDKKEEVRSKKLDFYSREGEVRSNSRESDKANEQLGTLPPKKEAVEEYMHSIGKTFDVDRFMDYYSSIGWKLKGEPISDVEALIRRWPDDHITHNMENHPEYRDIEEASRRTL